MSLLTGIKITLIGLGIWLIMIMYRDIKIYFWQDPAYLSAIENFQKQNDPLPYRIRRVWWSRIVVIKTATERVLKYAWFDRNYGIVGISILVLVIRKRPWELGLYLLGLIIKVLENDPNPGMYWWTITPFLIAGLI